MTENLSETERTRIMGIFEFFVTFSYRARPIDCAAWRSILLCGNRKQRLDGEPVAE